MAEPTATYLYVLLRPYAGGPHCGDQCGHWFQEGRAVLAIADGLGHGAEAEKASRRAMEFIAAHTDASPDRLVRGCNEALTGTRGAALGVAVVADGELRYAGVGNTRAMILADKTTRLGGNYGIVGAGFRNLTVETAPFPAGAVLVLSTDGVDEYFDLNTIDGWRTLSAEALSRLIADRWGRENDDLAVLVYRSGGEG